MLDQKKGNYSGKLPQSIEHVEKNEASKGHRCFSSCHMLVFHRHFVHPKCAADDDKSRQQNVRQQASRQNGFGDFSRRFFDHIWIHGL